MKKLLFLILVFISFIGYSQTQIGIDIDGEAASDKLGHVVSLSSDGTIMAIGAPLNDGNGASAGHVRIYENNSGTWVQIGNDIDGEAAGDEFGYSVSLSSDGTVVAIGARLNDGNGTSAGHVRIYKNNSGTWIQIGSDIDGEAGFDQFGYSVSLSSDGTIVAIGGIYNDGNGSAAGHVRIYENNSGTWVQIGSDIDGELAGDFSGRGLSLSSDGTIVAIGATDNDGTLDAAGHVRIYKNNSGTWAQIEGDIDGEGNYDTSGYSISLSSDGSIVAVGGRKNDGNGTNAGHVRVYENIADVWTQIGSDIDGEALGDYLGHSVSLSSDGTIVAIGARLNDGNGTNAGHVQIYKNISDVWTQLGSDIDGEATDDESGFSVSLSSDGSIVTIGATGNDGNGSSAGHVRVYDVNVNTFITGGVNTNWSTTGNWSGGTVPTATDNILIPSGKTISMDATNAVTKGLTVEGTLNIAAGKSLTTSGDFTNTGTVTITSDGTDSGVLIVEGATATGNVTYTRGGLLANKWSLISAPVTGQKIVAFAIDGNNNIRVNTTPNPDRYAIGAYDDAQAIGSKWATSMLIQM